MAEAGVNGVVTADVLTELSNDTVLTTEWINGGLMDQ
jgi:predicted unusual protein kinase regulating ubiquinone biosynthesis (AarF/ABC1/UbiB family)